MVVVGGSLFLSLFSFSFIQCINEKHIIWILLFEGMDIYGASTNGSNSLFFWINYKKLKKWKRKCVYLHIFTIWKQRMENEKLKKRKLESWSKCGLSIFSQFVLFSFSYFNKIKICDIRSILRNSTSNIFLI